MAKEKKEKKERKEIFVVMTLIAMAPILFVIIQNIHHSFSLAGKIRELNREAQGYQKQIEEDSLLLESIKFDEGLEKYAREKFFLQRKGERVFIIE